MKENFWRDFSRLLFKEHILLNLLIMAGTIEWFFRSFRANFALVSRWDFGF
jgi:hypothetical protein